MDQRQRKYYKARSKIHGRGVFAKTLLHKNQSIDIGIDYYFWGLIPYVTPHFGSCINHSYRPNSYLKYRRGKWYVIVSKSIPKDTEITLNYGKTPWYIKGPEAHFK